MGHHEPPKIHYNQAQLLGEGRMKVQLDQVSQIRGTNGQPWFTVVSLEDISPSAIAAHVQPPLC